ncbi:MAG: hypothetical protein IPJ65_01020 [Archangiaceae bacterium]|nr:hypothetical protein [Archangiaceae bacterium]
MLDVLQPGLGLALELRSGADVFVVFFIGRPRLRGSEAEAQRGDEVQAAHFTSSS